MTPFYPCLFNPWFECVLSRILCILHKLPSTFLKRIIKPTDKIKETHKPRDTPFYFNILRFGEQNHVHPALSFAIVLCLDRFPPSVPQGSGQSPAFITKGSPDQARWVETNQDWQEDGWVIHAVVHLACHRRGLKVGRERRAW